MIVKQHYDVLEFICLVITLLALIGALSWMMVVPSVGAVVLVLVTAIWFGVLIENIR